MSVGGVPAYRGWMNAWLHDPPGLPVPGAEDARLVDDPADDEKGYRIVRTEEAVFAAHPTRAHFRYPYLYGPYQLVPREWSIVRRILDGRRRIVVADDGLTLHHHGYTENLAAAVAARRCSTPSGGAGRSSTSADEEVLTVRQVVELCATELGAELEIVSMPYDLAVPAWPLLAQPSPTHRVLDLTRLHHQLGYRDVVPARRAVRRTARWLAEHPPAPGGPEEMVLTDPFDYAAEDALIDSWRGGPRRRSWCPSSPSSPGTGSRTAARPGGPARTRSSRHDRAGRWRASASSTCRSRSPGRTRPRCSPTRARRSSRSSGPGIGDIARWVGVSVNGMSSLYLVCNRGKRSIAVDVQQPARAPRSSGSWPRGPTS